MKVKLFLTLVAFGLITYNVVEATDATWDANSVKKVEVLTELINYWMKEAEQLEAQVEKFKANEWILTEKVKSLEEQLEFQEKEKLDISTHLAEVESKFAESEKCCKVSTDDTADKEQAINKLMTLLKEQKEKLRSCHNKSVEEDLDAVLNGTDSSENVDSCENQLTELRKERNFHFEKLTEVSRKFRETGSSCIVTSSEEMNVPEVELDFWMEKADICQEELRSCKENNINADEILKTRAEQEKTWQKAWAKHDYGMCVKACDLMRTAACKLAFNFLPFKGYLIECP